MAVLPIGIGSVAGAGGFNVERSLRFNSADSAYLSRTPASAGNRRTWTWSGWVKRTTVNTTGQNLFSTDNGSSTTVGQLFFNDGILELNCYASSAYQWRLITTQVWRDLSAWYHIVAVVDTTQATSSNRVKLYVNGTQITAFSTATYPSQNFDGAYNLNQPHYVGAAITSSGYLNGYLTEVNFIDGQALTPSSFGETDSNTGVWKPKAYSGTYGTNGFYLKFADNSGTTSTTLGKDSSGNGNNWTPNNFSVTAGVGNDSLVDSPTSYGTDTGVGGEVRGNYCTWNPLAKPAASSTSNGNLTAVTTTAADERIFSTIAVSSGKWYWEITPTAISSGGCMVAVTSSAYEYKTANLASGDDGYGYYTTGNKYNPSTATSYGNTFTTNDVIGVALDMDNGKIYFSKNGTFQNSGNPVAGTNAAFTSISGTYSPSVSNGGAGSSCTVEANFGQRPFAYTAPSGFKALCTQNLPTPTIGATSTTQAKHYFDIITWTDNSTGNKVLTPDFSPDMLWSKSRSNATDHAISDRVRGNFQLFPNQTYAEDTTQRVTWGTGNVTLNDGYGVVNETGASGYTYVDWLWKANGAGSSNTAGTITSTVSANTTSGFSIVTYTGTGANATVGHGLGVAPGMVILKDRGSVNSWYVWHSSLTGSQCLLLNLTNAVASSSTFWNSTIPSSTVFSLGTDSGPNRSTGTYVAYCFAPVAGYSAFGSYTGNGSTDGVFVYTGFRPRFILFKQSSAAGNDWYIYDAVRSTYNVATHRLFPNSSAAEATNFNTLDILSNGWKVRDSNSAWNASGATYIYAAFAESPFKYSLAR